MGPPAWSGRNLAPPAVMRDITSLTLATGSARNVETVSASTLRRRARTLNPMVTTLLLSGLHPRHQRGVDDIRQPLPAQRLDRQIRILQPEAMGGDLFQRKALGRDLLQRQLAGPEAVAAGALDGNRFDRQLLKRKIRELLELALYHNQAGLALQRIETEQDRRRPRPCRAVERDIDALAAGDLHDAAERIFLLHIDHVVCAEELGDLQPGRVLGGAGDDDERRAGLLADHGLRQALLPRPLDQHGGIIAHIRVEQRPFHPVRHRRDESRQLRRHALRDVMHHGVPRQIDILREAAPKMGCALRRGVAVADAIGIGAPVGVFAVTILTLMAPFALATHHVVLDEYQVAFLEALAPRELAPSLGDGPDILVAHDGRRGPRRVLVELDVGAADAGDLHLHERRVLRHVRHWKLADLHLAWADPDRSEEHTSEL